jgi:hypothetical protein
VQSTTKNVASQKATFLSSRIILTVTRI